MAISAAVSQNLALVGDGPPLRAVPLQYPALSNGVFCVSLKTQNKRVYALE